MDAAHQGLPADMRLKPVSLQQLHGIPGGLCYLAAQAKAAADTAERAATKASEAGIATPADAADAQVPMSEIC